MLDPFGRVEDHRVPMVEGDVCCEGIHMGFGN